MNAAVADPTILLDHYHLPPDSCLTLVDGVIQGTAYIVSDGSFNPDSSAGSAGTSAVVLAPPLTVIPNFTPKATTG